MAQLYTFSPITTKEQFDAALEYIVRQASELSEKLTGTRLKVVSAKVFAHYPEEYEFMKQIIVEYGTLSNIGRSTSTYVDCSLNIADSHLTYIGIRVPDPYRMQAGCGDYAIEKPEEFVASLPKNEHGYVRAFPDMPEDFIELWHPDYDVAGYIALK